MKEKILGIIDRSYRVNYYDVRYKYYDAFDNKWIYSDKLYNEFESIIEKDFDVRGVHKIIRTSEQLIIIEVSYGYNPLELFVVAHETNRSLYRAHGAFIEDISIRENTYTDIANTTLNVKLSKGSADIILESYVRYLTDKKTTFGVRIESNQLSMRFYA